MKYTLLVLKGIASFALALTVGLAGSPSAAYAEDFKLIQTPEVVAMKGDGKPLQILDANNAKTRAEDGIVPGAVLLPSASDYEVAATLPAAKDTRLVFYCANERCTASHTAAKRAKSGGYTNVFVMSDGIQGWKKAGQQTASAAATKAG